ncbi:uncharacterized protein PG998_000250 [Apiospora kogelbergensis]|uniref:Uncharacterized protein n=1 Tax=Apiospora kogelbergensis TaxID=1337665 RepID=A0AAW0QXU0_9PEZI
MLSDDPRYARGMDAEGGRQVLRETCGSPVGNVDGYNRPEKAFFREAWPIPLFGITITIEF